MDTRHSKGARAHDHEKLDVHHFINLTKGARMDFSLLSGVGTAITLAKDIGKAAIGLRDANQLALVVSQMNEQLLKAQDGLFAHNTELLKLQQQHFEVTQELRKLKEAASERNRYLLFELRPGAFVYRANARPIGGEAGDPVSAEPEHYICQPCFDKPDKTKSVLRFYAGDDFMSGHRECPVCTAIIAK